MQKLSESFVAALEKDAIEQFGAAPPEVKIVGYEPPLVAAPYERDPNGIDTHVPGAKLDAGKPLAWTVLGGFGVALSESLSNSAPSWITAALAGEPWYMVARSYINQHGLRGVVDVGTFGARKYSKGGWKEVPDALERYSEAFGRHVRAILDGEETADDSGLPHHAHAGWNALACAYCKANPQ